MVGPNGGGKTSLAKAIMGIYPLSGGAILLDGEDISTRTITERANMGIGYAFQSPTRFKGLRVRDFLSIAAGENDEKRMYSLLVDVGLCAQDYIDRELNASFSGGELKRVEIASILARELRVALFDEPEAGIDLWSFQRLTEPFRGLNEMSDTTIVIISHQERILRLADEVILIAGGKVTEITSPDKLLWDIDCKNPGCDCLNCVEKEVMVC
jgi:Fe-S cluster assembly ATP-binding protein